MRRYLTRVLFVLLAVGSGFAMMIMLRDARKAAAVADELVRLERQIHDYETLVRDSGELKLRSMRRHHKAVKQSRNALFEDLFKLQVASGEPVSPLACKVRIIEAGQKMRMQLEGRDVALGDAAQAFGFSAVTQSGKMPERSEVPELLRRLELTEEIVDLVARSDVDGLVEFSYKGTERQARSTALSFRITCTGEFAGLRNLVARFNGARYFLVVRSVRLSRSPDQAVTAEIDVDYLLFHELKEGLADAG